MKSNLLFWRSELAFISREDKLKDWWNEGWPPQLRKLSFLHQFSKFVNWLREMKRLLRPPSPLRAKPAHVNWFIEFVHSFPFNHKSINQMTPPFKLISLSLVNQWMEMKLIHELPFHSLISSMVSGGWLLVFSPVHSTSFLLHWFINHLFTKDKWTVVEKKRV